MKKLIPLILAAMFCLSACGSSAELEKYQKYDTLIDALESGNYEQAMQEVQRFYTENQPTQSEDSEESRPLYEYLTGPWIQVPNYGYDNAEHSVSLSSDGTCIIDGADLVWTEYDYSDNRLYLQLQTGLESSGNVHLSIQNGVPELTLYDENGQSLARFFYEGSCSPVELTVDNWSDYLEIISIPHFQRNAFNEPEGFSITHYMVIKEEYADRLYVSPSSAALEISYTNTDLPCSVDFDQESYTLGEALATYEEVQTVAELYDDGEHVFIASFVSSYADLPSETMYFYPSDIQILRIAGTLYLKN